MRSVFFDVDGVLIHSLFHADVSRRRRWDRHIEEDLGVTSEAFAGFFATTFTDVIEGRKSIVPALDAFLPSIGYKRTSLDFLSYWLTRDAELNLQLIDVVKRLRIAGARLFIATNQEHIRAFHLWNAVGLRHHFDDMFYAARFGAGKGSPDFYRKVDALIGKQSEPPLFFDDSAGVVRIANEHGWEAVLFADIADCANHPWVAKQLARRET